MTLTETMRRDWAGLLTLPMLLGMSVAQADTTVVTQTDTSVTIDTSVGWDHRSSIRWFAVPNTTTYGQTFYATEPEIDAFSFVMKGALPSTHLEMKAFIYAWTGQLVAGFGGSAVGNPLFISPTLTYDGSAWGAVSVDTHQADNGGTVHPNGIALVPGQAYVIGLTMADSGNYDASSGYASFGLTHSDYSAKNGGGFVFSNTGDGGLDSLTLPWNPYQNFGDLVFTASFTLPAGTEPGDLPDQPTQSVPDGGASVSLLSLGFLGLTVLRRSRKS